jgi:hypothetical protein
MNAQDAINPKQELMNRVIDNEQAVRKVLQETNPTLPKIKIDDFIERAKLGKAGTDDMANEILKKLDNQKLSPKSKKPLIKAQVVSKVDGMKKVVKVEQLQDLAKNTDKESFVRDFVE